MRSVLLALLLMPFPFAVVAQRPAAEGFTGTKVAIPPADDGPKDPSFVQFRRQLLASVEADDIARILEVVDSDVAVNQLKTDRGIAALRREWTINESPTRFLRELGAILRLGGRLRDDGREFIAPYVAADFTLDSGHLPAEYTVALHRNVPVYRDQEGKGPEIARLSYDVVQYTPVGLPWMWVILRDGRKGYVRESALRSPADTHAIFRKTPAGWKLVEFFGWAD